MICLNNILVEEVNDKTNFYIADFGLSKTKETLFDTVKKMIIHVGK